MSDTTEVKFVLRYTATTDQPDDVTYDIIWWDRLTGKRVYSYDGADPANTEASHGAITDEEVFEEMGLNIHEEIDMKLSVMPVGEHDVQHLILKKERNAEREKEEAESQDLFEFFGDRPETMGFSYDHWGRGEREILKPALEKKGYSHITFYTTEQDSFGVLNRACRAKDPDDKWVRFYYG